MKYKSLVLYIFCIFFLSACYQNQNPENRITPSKQRELVTGNVTFRPYNDMEQKLEGVEIVVIDYSDQVIDVLVTGKNGEVSTRLTVPVDQKYSNTYSGALETRGTVTAIAYKNGYRSVVIFEVPVEEFAIQPFRMLLELPGERNEPIGILGNVHHIKINALVDKYSKYTE